MDKNDAGAYSLLSSDGSPIDRASCSVVLSFKAARRVGPYLGMKVGDYELNFLCAVWMWSKIKGKREAGLTRIINWTGYHKKWKSVMYQAAANCIRLGLIEEIPKSGGKRIVLSTKGKRVIEVYNQLIETVRLEELAKALQGAKGSEIKTAAA